MLPVTLFLALLCHIQGFGQELEGNTIIRESLNEGGTFSSVVHEAVYETLNLNLICTSAGQECLNFSISNIPSPLRSF